MTKALKLEIAPLEIDAIATQKGRVAVVVSPEGKLNPAARRINKLTRGTLARFFETEGFEKLKEGEAKEFALPVGMSADVLLVVKLSNQASAELARKAGASIGVGAREKATSLYSGSVKRVEDLMLGAALKAYKFSDHLKEGPVDDAGSLTAYIAKPEEASTETINALIDGVFFTRDLVSEPAIVLSTIEFANRLKELEELGLEVEVLEEDALEKLGMRTLLSVGQGSETPSKVVVMQWKGGEKDAAPLAFIGKGVVFDTGGISLKPAAGMEDMTMDMGGAGVVSGVMKSIALRKPAANVVGLVGLVENMPDGKATRPGDIVKSMKGDTVEIINTDAEGRLVLADVLWYAQDRFAPRGMVDLATLTGAIMIALGHENAGVFSNDDAFCNAFLKAAATEGEGAWRMPMGDAYDAKLKSDKADMKNVGPRWGGSITAAQFLRRFVKEDTPWIHLDIAGAAQTPAPTALAPKGATGWGVLALNRMVDDFIEVDAKKEA